MSLIVCLSGEARACTSRANPSADKLCPSPTPHAHAHALFEQLAAAYWALTKFHPLADTDSYTGASALNSVVVSEPGGSVFHRTSSMSSLLGEGQCECAVPRSL